MLATGLREIAAREEIADNPSTAFRRATTEDYDLIVLDLMLRGMSGLQVCASVRAQRNYTPIIVLTAKSAAAEKIAVLDAGADDYVTKPFSMQELLSGARGLLRRSR